MAVAPDMLFKESIVPEAANVADWLEKRIDEYLATNKGDVLLKPYTCEFVIAYTHIMPVKRIRKATLELACGEVKSRYEEQGWEIQFLESYLVMTCDR